MWKPEHRQAAERHGLRYPSDLSDAEWALVEPMVPPAKHGGRPRDVNVREVLNAICYVLSTGCQWQALPRTCHRRAQRTITSCCGTGTARWRASTTRSTSRPASRPDAKQARRRRSLTVRAPRPLKKGLCARPAGVRCRQEGHGTQAPHPRRYARPAVERDRSPCRRAGSRWRPPSAADGASSASLHRMHLRGCRISGAEDGEGHCRTGCWTLQIVKRRDAHHFVVLPKRWIVERTIAWISRNRRLARDFERYARTVAAFVRLAMIRIMLRRLTRPTLCS